MLIINEIPHLNRLDQSISVQRVVAIYSHFTFIFRLNVLNSEDRKGDAATFCGGSSGPAMFASVLQKGRWLIWVELTDIFLYYKEVFKQ